MKKKNKSTKTVKGIPKGEKPLGTAFRLSSTTYFLTYKGISDSGQKITKNQLADYLLNHNPNDLKLRPIKYLICQQMYDSGQPHFHAILVYQRRKGINNQAFFDFKGIHPNIQTMRNMKAALEYVYKEDAHPLTNMDIIQQRRVAKSKDSSSLYQFLRQQMMKDPFNFNVFRYCLDHNIDKQIYKTNYTKAVRLLKDVQQVYCNNLLTERPGFKPITQAIIQAKLSASELETFYSWEGYQKIVDHLNNMVRYRGYRQQKSLNLLLTGRPDCGKSALVWQRNPPQGYQSLLQHCSVYPMGMSQWFPKYQSDVYHCIYWNQAKLTSYSYDTILKLLDGSPLDLSNKGSVSRKVDNPLIIMTSNMTLQQMIQQKFHYNKSYQQMARKNLTSRIQNIIVPPHLELFLIQKLLVPI